jgi:hypothetical protein
VTTSDIVLSKTNAGEVSFSILLNILRFLLTSISTLTPTSLMFSHNLNFLTKHFSLSLILYSTSPCFYSFPDV